MKKVFTILVLILILGWTNVMAGLMPAPAPLSIPSSVTTNNATNITATTVTLNGSALTQTGCTMTFYFEYGTTTSYGSSSLVPTPASSYSNISATIYQLTGLSPGTTYHYRIWGNLTGTSSGIFVGGDITFTTLVLPTITSFTPESGAIGSSVTISGTGFNTTAAQNIVFFGATKAVVTAASALSLTVTVPLGATYQYLTVTNLATKLTAYSAKPFNVTLAGSMTFTDEVSFKARDQVRDVSIMDIDGDGKPDLVGISNNYPYVAVSILRNTSSSGSLSFAAKVDSAKSTGFISISIGDIDGDGKPDLVVANLFRNIISVFLNTSTPGSVSFATKVDFPTGSGPTSLIIGDIDGDGKPDLVVANNSPTDINWGNTVSVFLNTSTLGSVSFATKVDLLTGDGPNSVSIGDIDGDGKVDLAVANFSNTVSLLRNTSISGTVSFAAKVDFATGNYSYFVSIGDIDGDGKADLAVVNTESNDVSVLRNTSSSGSVSFATKVDFATASDPYSVSIGDIDGDGKPDLALPNYNNNTVTVFRNTSISGTVSFAAKVDFAAGNYPSSVSIGDIDGDGKPDLVVANPAESKDISVIRQINPVQVTASLGTTTGVYTTLKAAFDSINSGYHKGVITIQIKGSIIETASAKLNANGSGSAVYSAVTIYPTVTGLSISGAIDGPLVDLNGADNVSIDGRVNATGTTKDLVIANTSTSGIEGTSTLRFIESAENNIIKYCKVKGSATEQNPALCGIIYFAASSTGNGNNSDTIDNCDITSSAAGRANYAILSIGSSSRENSGIVISNNNIYDFSNPAYNSFGIMLYSNSSAWKIKGNSFYETTSFVPSTGGSYGMINIISGNNYEITNNFMGGSSANCNGIWEKSAANSNHFYGIYLVTDEVIASSIQGNTIKNINWSNNGSSPWFGIFVSTGNVNIGNITGNTIGSSVGTASIRVNQGGNSSGDVYGILCQNSGIANIRNNTIGSFTLGHNNAGYAANFYGIKLGGGPRNAVISNNIIGSTTEAASINLTSLSTSALQNMSGIRCENTGSNNITGNTIANLTNANSTTGGTVKGIDYNSSVTSSTVNGNFIHSLSSSSNNTALYGIFHNSGPITYSNNIISLGSDVTTGNEIYGIKMAATSDATINMYYNTVYIGGTVSGTTNSTFALSNGATFARNYRNNIFNNSRSGGTTGKHYAISLSNNTDLTINYNDYYAPNGVLGIFNGDDKATLANWKTSSGGDIHSKNANPIYASAGGTLAENYKPSQPTLQAVSGTGVLLDYDSITRSTTLPSMGAYEILLCTNPTTGGTIASNQTICTGATPTIFTSVSLPTGHTGTLEYQWQRSTDSIDFVNLATGTYTTTTYQVDTITVNTWYRRLARVSCMPDWNGCDTSNIVKITVRPEFISGTISSTGETICYNGNPANIGSPTAASGGNDTITYEWYKSINSFTDSTLIGSNTETYDPPAGLTQTTSYRRYTHDGSCNPDFALSGGEWTVTVYDNFTTGTIASTGETICYNGDPASIGSTTLASGGNDTITYEWYKSTNNFTDSTLISSNTATYDPPAGLTQTTTYRRYAHNGSCNPDFTVSDGEWTVTVSEVFTAGITQGYQTIVQYPFASNTNYNLLSTDVSEAILDFTNLDHYTIADDGYGVVLQSYPTDTTISATDALANNIYFTLTLNAVKTLYLDSLIFEVGKGGSSDPRGFFIRSSVDDYTNNLFSETLPSGSQLAPSLHKLGLNDSFKGISTVTFRFYVFSPNNNRSVDWRNLKIVYGIQGETICYNGNPAEIGSTTLASGGNDTITYEWYKSTDNFTDSTLIASNTSTYDPPTGLTTTTSYRRYAHDGSCNNSFVPSTGTYVVTVYPDFTSGTIASTGETICYNGNPAIIGSTTAASGGNDTITYEWYKSTTNFTDSTIIGSNTASYDPPTGLTTTTSYRRYAHDGKCNNLFVASAGTWIVTVYDNFSTGEIPSTGETVFYDGDPAVISSTTDASGGFGVISYQWQRSTTGSSSGFADISGATVSTYNQEDTITLTTWYRRQAKDEGCNASLTLSAGVWKVTVVNAPSVIVRNNMNIGYGSLRTAIANVSDAGTVTFVNGINGQIITLTTGTLCIDKNIILDNSNHANGIIISGAGDNITINTGKVLTLASNSRITVIGAIKNNAGKTGLVLESGSSFIQNNVNLQATAKRYLNSGWHLFGTPFKKNLLTMANLAPVGGSLQVKPYNNGTNWQPIISSSYSYLIPTTGYAIKPSANYTMTLSGNLYYSPLTPDYTNSLIYNGTSGTQSWNLMANPYTSYINWKLMGKTNINQTLYLWDNTLNPTLSPTTNTTYFRTYNALSNVGVPIGTTPYIAPLQGFFVKATYTNPKLTFPPSARTHSNSAYYKDASTEIVLRLKAETEEGADELVICKNTAAKQGFEEFDSEKMLNGNPLELYSYAKTGEKLTINTIGNTQTIIPLGINGMAGSKAKITAFALETSQQVYLEDRHKGKLISLSENTEYSFEFPTNELQGRFFIRFGDVNSPLQNSDVKVFENNNELNVIAQTGENIEQLEVYSLTGACLFKANGNSNMFTTSLDLAGGVYMIRVKTNITTQNVKLNWK